MREMKDSGIEWCGNIPINWEIHPLYYYLKKKKNIGKLVKLFQKNDLN